MTSFGGYVMCFYYSFNYKGMKFAHYFLSQRNSHEEEIRLVNVGIPELLQVYYLAVVHQNYALNVY